MTEHRLLPHGTTGIAIDIEADGSHRDAAAELERLGYDTLWIAGGQMMDTLEPPRELIGATYRARVATGIVAFGVHDDAAIAKLYADLDPSGRFVLGLGGPQQARPLPALREHLAALDAAGIAPHDRLLAALGPRKMEIARERSAGPITLLTTPESTAETRDRLGPGPTLAVQQLAVLEQDPRRARAAAHQTVGFLGTVAGYRANFHRMGFSDADVDDVTDRFVDAVVAWGDADAIRARLDAHRDAGADHVAVSLLASEGGADKLTAAAEVADALRLR